MRAEKSQGPSSDVSTLEQDYISLVGHFSRIVRDPLLAEDLVHDAVVAALAKLRSQQIADPTRITGFVYRVAQNLLRNHRRRHCNRNDFRATDCDLDALAADEDLLHLLVTRDAALRMRRVIDNLPNARDRELMRRFYLEEEDKDSICADLKLTAPHFDRVLSRARQRLRVMLTD